MSKLSERSNPLRPFSLEGTPLLSFSSLTIVFGMAVNRLFAIARFSNPAISPIRRGNACRSRHNHGIQSSGLNWSVLNRVVR